MKDTSAKKGVKAMESGMILGKTDELYVVSCKDCVHKVDCPFKEVWLTLGVDDGYCRFGIAKDDVNCPKKPEDSNL